MPISMLKLPQLSNLVVEPSRRAAVYFNPACINPACIDPTQLKLRAFEVIPNSRALKVA